MYVNAVDLAFWPNKAMIGQWQEEMMVNRKDDPSQRQILAAGDDYQDAMRVLLTNAREMGLVMSEELVAHLMEEAVVRDKDEGGHQQPVYVGIITGTVH